ncbi:ethanolamine utilization protein EutJ family protein [Alkaliphilus metalliredigens QYMF]|uniref:Chaperone protein DnaK n=1 Tax=Alkaliphilus metalliredigens (strain QYMF) TaxID=293826 RepID=A6TUT0_ALKMQ|nr:ethanolamine utilization protein EutJ [Alkaliphilus metalliredigens]ABR49948.1 ethanolamine utilization protein EutJ family protein [Alkaliphilus metalliredigens QYMF]
MSQKSLNHHNSDLFVKEFEKVIEKPKTEKSKVYYTGIDLGTACVVISVLNEYHQPVAGAYKYADVVRDGMVVDYIGAIKIVRELKQEIEEKLKTELIYGAAAIPPGTDVLDSGVVRNVVEAAGFVLTNVLDEPTAANKVLNIQNGAVVDIGGGTTGISILKDGEVVYIADEATGGTHFSLVLSGSYGWPFEEAEVFKREKKNHKEILPILKPVIEKISSIISRHTDHRDVREIHLVGGTSCLTGIEKIIEKRTGITTYKPRNPMFVTPLGIALSCTQEELE